MFEFSEPKYINLCPIVTIQCVRALVRVCVRACSVRRSVRVSAFKLSESNCCIFLLIMLVFVII